MKVLQQALSRYVYNRSFSVIFNQVKLLRTIKLTHFLHKKQINFWFTVNVALLIVSFFFHHASAKHHAKSDILSSYNFQLLPFQSRKFNPYNERCTQQVEAVN